MESKKNLDGREKFKQIAEWKKDVSRLNESRKSIFKFEKKEFDIM